jgi:hypothetical protein
VVRGARYTFVAARIAAAHANWAVTGLQQADDSPAAEAAESAAQCLLLRDIYGNPFHPVALNLAVAFCYQGQMCFQRISTDPTATAPRMARPQKRTRPQTRAQFRQNVLPCSGQ